MADTYDVLAPDGSVLQYRDDHFSEISEVRSRAQHDQLIADGWIALDERIEQSEAPKRPSALEEALTESVVAPRPALQVTVYILGRLKPDEKGEQVV